MSKYAEHTTTPPQKTYEDIKKTLKRYGADAFLLGEDANHVSVAFRVKGRHLRFKIPFPPQSDFRRAPNRWQDRFQEQQQKLREQAIRQRWRILLLLITAKLEAVDNEILSFEEAFLSDTPLPTGETVAEWADNQVRLVYETGKMPPLLLSAGGSS